MTDITTCNLKISEFYKDQDPETIKEIGKYADSVIKSQLPRSKAGEARAEFIRSNDKMNTSKIMNIMDTVTKTAMIVNRLSDPRWNKDVKQGILSTLEQTSSQVEDAGMNVEVIHETKQRRFHAYFKSDMVKIGMIDDIRMGTFDKEIADVIRSGTKYTGPMADRVNAAASLFKKYYKMMNMELNDSGIKVFYRGDYTGPVSHDGNAIYGNFKDWVSDLTTALDYAEEFKFSPADIAEFEALKRDGLITEKSKNVVVQTFYESYKNIARDNPMFIDDNGSNVGDYSFTSALESEGTKKPMSISQRRAQAKSFTMWKSGSDLIDYQRKWGKHKTLGEAYEAYSQSAARDVSLATVYGAAPYKGFEMVKGFAKEKMKMLGMTPAQIEKEMSDIDKAWNIATKPTSIKAGGLGKAAMTFRQAAAMAVLGKAGITSFFLDPAATARQRRDLFGEGLIKSVYNTYKTYVPTILDAEGRKEAGDMYLYMLNENTTMVEELGLMGKNMQLASDIVNTVSLGRFFNKVSHITNAKMYMKFLADADFNKMTDQAKADLKKYNITAKDAEVLKKLDLKESGMVNINRLTPEEFAALTGLKGSELVDFQNKMNAWLLDKIKKGAPIPGRRERRILLGDTVPGTREGELRRWLFQFRSTSLKTTFDATIGSARTLNPSGPQGGGFKQQMLKRNSIYSAGLFASHMTVAGGAMLLLSAISRNDEKDLERFENADPTLLLSAFSRGGGGLMLGDIITMNDNYLYNIGQLASPAVGAAAKTVSAVGQAVNDRPGKAVTSVTRSLLPAANHIILDPFWAAMEEQSKKRSGNNSINYLK